MNWFDFNSGLIQSCQWTYLIKTFACLRVAKIPKVFNPTSRSWATISINTSVSRYMWWHFVTFRCLTTGNQHFSFVIFIQALFYHYSSRYPKIDTFPTWSSQNSNESINTDHFLGFVEHQEQGTNCTRPWSCKHCFSGKVDALDSNVLTLGPDKR